MPTRFKDPIAVPTAVLDGLETVRESSDTNMQDPSRVKYLAARLGYPETAAWIAEHPEDYAEGVFRGFVGDWIEAVATTEPRGSDVAASEERGGEVPPEGQGREKSVSWWRELFSG